MAMKKRQVAKAPAPNDNTVIKAAYGIGIFAILLLAVSRLIPYYEVNRYLFEIKDSLAILQYIFAGIGVGFLALWFILKKKFPKANYMMMSLAVLFLLAGGSASFLYDTWVSYVTLLYAGYVVLLIIYLVYLLYPIEFFLITVSVAMSGFAFYTMQKGLASIFTLAVTFLFLLLCGTLAYLGSKNNGKIGKKTLFPAPFNPTNLYINSALWLVCLIGSLVLGPVFAYCSIFAAGAVWLVFAVYYTIKLA